MATVVVYSRPSIILHPLYPALAIIHACFMSETLVSHTSICLVIVYCNNAFIFSSPFIMQTYFMPPHGSDNQGSKLQLQHKWNKNSIEDKYFLNHQDQWLLLAAGRVKEIWYISMKAVGFLHIKLNFRFSVSFSVFYLSIHVLFMTYLCIKADTKYM